MKGSNPRRLVVISLMTALVVVAVFGVAYYQRYERAMHPPPPTATPVSAIHVLPGFKVELLHSATTNEDSWISMTIDPQGRLIISPHAGKLLRMTLAKGKVTKIERLDLPCTDAMGLLYASNSLFLDCNGPKGTGIYRAHDSDGTYGPPELLRPMSFLMYEHGSHAIVMGPDEKLYVVCGDRTTVPSDILPSSPLTNYADDQLLPRAEDGKGFGVGLLPPAGFLLRMDMDGRNCELLAGGTRNVYSIAFNPEGELFGFDNDMDWDFGLAWYKPTRIYHWVSGGDYGFRQGSGKFPDYYEDALPPTLNVGLGAPSGVMFGTKSKFPKRYQDACFMQDWAYGRLFAVHFIPRGATYDATIETVLRGAPLTMTALQFGQDGDLYFITGGRDTPAGLYRLSYDGTKIQDELETKARQARDAAAKTARSLRRQLESFHGRRDPNAAEVVWPSLNNPDRWIRYAARVALEFQDVASWKDHALAETNIDGGLTALLALARCGRHETQASLLHALDKFPFSQLTQEQKLLKLRAMELSFIRQGHPSDTLTRRATEVFDPLYPGADENVNQELCALLLYLQAPDATAKTVAMLDKASTFEDQTYYVMRLRNITNGWTIDLRKDYLSWFEKNRDHVKHRPELEKYFRDVDLDYSQGSSVPGYLNNFLDEVGAALSAGERKTLADYFPDPPANSVAQIGHKFVKQWRISDLEPDLRMLQWHRSKARGRAIFSELGCVMCHRFANRGGSVGPDLTAVGSRLTGRGILESILEPSKVLPDQYQNTMLTLRNGDVLSGRVMQENPQRIVFMTDLIKRTTTEIRQKDILSRRASKISPMPEGLVNALKEDEIWDLIFYLKSGGNKPQLLPAK